MTESKIIFLIFHNVWEQNSFCIWNNLWKIWKLVKIRCKIIIKKYWWNITVQMDICCRPYRYKKQQNFYIPHLLHPLPQTLNLEPWTINCDIINTEKMFYVLNKLRCPFSIPFAAEFPLQHENKETKHPIVCDAYKLLQSNVPQVFCMQDRVGIKSL